MRIYDKTQQLTEKVNIWMRKLPFVMQSGLFRYIYPVGITPLAISFYLVSKYNTREPEVS
jgi:hypothetical protein